MNCGAAAECVEWWTMVWTGVQAFGVTAALFVGLYQIGTVRRSDRIRATVDVFDRWERMNAALGNSDFLVNFGTAYRDYNEDLIKESYGKMEPDEKQKFSVDLLNFYGRAADLYYADVLDRKIYMQHMDVSTLAVYIAMEKVFELAATELKAEIDGVRRLARDAQKHYRSRRGPQAYLRDFPIGGT